MERAVVQPVDEDTDDEVFAPRHHTGKRQQSKRNSLTAAERNFVKGKGNQSTERCAVFLPDSVAMERWDILSVVLLGFTAIVTPFELACVHRVPRTGPHAHTRT